MSSPLISERAERALREIGLTEYETLAYLSLLRNGEMTAENVSDASSIPYSKV
ncbi:TrmB family transcriptional regulator, partial [Candidatus Bathyarchaeota archaeon]